MVEVFVVSDVWFEEVQLVQRVEGEPGPLHVTCALLQSGKLLHAAFDYVVQDVVDVVHFRCLGPRGLRDELVQLVRVHFWRVLRSSPGNTSVFV